MAASKGEGLGDLNRQRISELASELSTLAGGTVGSEGSGRRDRVTGRFEVTPLGTRVRLDDKILGLSCCCCTCCFDIDIDFASK